MIATAELLVAENTRSDQWVQFKQRVQSLDDPLLDSIVRQLQWAEFQPDTFLVLVNLPEQFGFFCDVFWDKQTQWLPILRAIFGAQTTLQLKLQAGYEKVTTTLAAGSVACDANVVQPAVKIAKQSQKNEQSDFSDPEKWPKTKLLLDFFPGTVRIKE